MSAGPDVVARELVSVDPATLETVGRVPVTAPEELAEAISEARAAQTAFAREPLAARRRLIARVGHVLVEDDRRIAETIVAESGKPLAEASAWLERYRASWEANFERLDSVLEELQRRTSASTRARRRIKR